MGLHLAERTELMARIGSWVTGAKLSWVGVQVATITGRPTKYCLAITLCWVLAGCSSGCGYIDIKHIRPGGPDPDAVYTPCLENNFVSTEPCVVGKAGVAITDVFGASITNWMNPSGGTTLSASIPDGYYEAQSVQFTDSNLVAHHILAGVSIFGVNGTASVSYSPCNDEALNSGACSTAPNRYVYADAFGGRSSVCAAGFNGVACWTPSSNQYVTNQVGSDITAWANPSSSTTVTGTIPMGYYPGNTISFSDGNLLPSHIRWGVSIFNVAGTYVAGVGDLLSNQHRDRSQSPITQLDETVAGAGTAYTNDPNGYRAVPRIWRDDEGTTGTSVDRVTRTNWNTTCDLTTGASGGSADNVCKCGLVGTIEERIADCAGHGVIGSQAYWNGAVRGNAGQGEWKLVTRTGAVVSSRGREVWRDERTKLLWSSLVSTDLNWCKASGSNFITNNPAAENDPSDYCDNVANQVTGVWSEGFNKAVSACFEDVDDNGPNDFFTTDDPGLGIDNDGKGGLSLGSSPAVFWRLPTIYDYKQADVNGLRFVTPDASSWEWSSSVFSFNRAFAWLFVGNVGYVFNDARTGGRAVRCLGR